METNIIIQGDALTELKKLPSESINCVMTSPPYWGLRDYGVEGQLGLEPTIQEYVINLCNVMDECKRVLRKDGVLFINIGDSYNNSSWANKKKTDDKLYSKVQGTHSGRGGQLNYPDKCLSLTPFRFSIEMINRGWILRNTIIWHKLSCMPSSVKDRFTNDFEYIFFFVKDKDYYFETQYEPYSKSTKEDRRFKPGSGENHYYNGKTEWDVDGLLIKPQRGGFKQGALEGRNKRCVWSINPKPLKESHFATFPEKLIDTPLKAGCPINGIVLDPFFGAGTTGLVALKQNKKFIGIELNKEYIKIAEARIKPFLEQKKLC